MRRREFIALLGGAAVMLPRATRGQLAAKMPRIGWLSPGPAGPSASLAGFLQALHELGYWPE